MTIVGMVPPVYYKGDLLVDGGYMNNIPVDVMRSMGVDTVRTWPPGCTPGWTDFCVTASHANPAEGTQMQSGAGKQYRSLWSEGGSSMKQPPCKGHGCI
jgi:hypothetical protein